MFKIDKEKLFLFEQKLHNESNIRCFFYDHVSKTGVIERKDCIVDYDNCLIDYDVEYTNGEIIYDLYIQQELPKISVEDKLTYTFPDDFVRIFEGKELSLDFYPKILENTDIRTQIEILSKLHDGKILLREKL